MAENKLAVDTIRLGSDADGVAESVRALEAEIRQFEDEYQRLNAMWEGPASEVFLETYRNDILDLQDIIKALQEFSVFELNANAKYQRCADEVGEIIRSI